MLPVATVVTVCSSTVVVSPRPIGADTVASAQAKAAAIEASLNAAQAKEALLGQQYDADETQLSQVNASITVTKANIVKNEKEVAGDKATLQSAAISSYVSNGSASTDNPIFSNNETQLGATTEYDEIATGDINQEVANLHTAENKLSAQQAQLTSEQGQAQAAASAEQSNIAQNQQLEQQQSAALAQANGEVATLIQQQEAAQAAAAAQETQAKVAAAQQAAASGSGSSGGGSSGGSTGGTGPSVGSNPAPPTAPGGEGAVQAAETQLGVPYVYGTEDPGVSFDCSGLVQWAWEQVGVDLPRTSGEQFGASTPVSVADLEPGDLLFYGPAGDDHVAMYVGGGDMIEAPEKGQTVHITPIRLSTDPSTDYGEAFAGAGRP